MKYCVWKVGHEIAGHLFTGSLSACIRYAVMMGGENYYKNGYRVEAYFCS